MLGECWGNLGVILGEYWGILGNVGGILGEHWGKSGGILG